MNQREKKMNIKMACKRAIFSYIYKKANRVGLKLKVLPETDESSYQEGE